MDTRSRRRHLLILAIATALIVPSQGFSQTLVGIRGGIAVAVPTSLLGPIPDDVGGAGSPRPAFSGGLQYVASNQNPFSLELQMLILQHSYTEFNGLSGTQFKVADSYLSFPILLRMSQSPAPLRFFGFVGPELDYIFDETSQAVGESKTYHRRLDGETLKLSLLFGFGLEKTLSDQLTCSLDLGYQISLLTFDLLNSEINNPMADDVRLMFGMMYALNP
jgi:hypothetical protein